MNKLLQRRPRCLPIVLILLPLSIGLIARGRVLNAQETPPPAVTQQPILTDPTLSEARQTEIPQVVSPEAVGAEPDAAPDLDIAPKPTSEASDERTVADEIVLRFSFNGAPWRDVIRWVADEAGLALHIGDVPPGSFTYSDTSQYDTAGAIDRINLFLLAEGFTLVRSGDLLSVINLADPRSLSQLDVLARQVTVEQLSAMGNDHEVVKCMFPLGDIDADEAVDELAALSLMSTPTVLSKTNQLMITDTTAKLKNVRDVLSAFQPSLMDNGTVVKTFALQNVEAEDVLVVARPHLGLATGEMIGIDVSLSADLQGRNLFVTGVEDKVKLIERLVEAIDRPDPSMSAAEGGMVLRSHLVEGGNVDVVYNVLQTLLAGQTVRLSIDYDASSVVALASEPIQTQIAETVSQIQASDAQFEVIPLKNTDPFFVITLLEQMLNLPGPLDDPTGKNKGIDPNAPKIDADPANRRLFVRAKRHQIDEIKRIVEGLEATEANSLIQSDDGKEVRVLPVKGRRAEQLLETAATFWRDSNPVIIYPSSDNGPRKVNERVPGADPEEAVDLVDEVAGSRAIMRRSETSHLTAIANSRLPAIRCQVTPRGVLLQSEDSEALNRFEQHLRVILGPIETLPSAPIVFYLQHTRPDDALRMLGELLDGGQSAIEATSGSLVNGYVSGGPSASFLGSMVSSQEGTTTMMAGSITVVADSRLNRLIAQGSEEDIALIESYLEIIDKDQSIASIETRGRSHVIELLHTRAEEVAEAIRDAFVGRVAEDSKSRSEKGGQSSLRGSGSIDPREAFLAARAAGLDEIVGSKKSTKNEPEPARDLEPKMTVAVHEPSNSLIVTAPAQLFAEVEALAKQIDSRGEQAVEIITPTNSEIYGILLQQLTSGESGAAISSSGASVKSKSKPVSSSASRSK